LPGRTFRLPVNRSQVAPMGKNGPVRKMKLRVRPRGHAGIRPRHPGMGAAIRIAENRPLCEKFIGFADRILDCPLHSETSLPFPRRKLIWGRSPGPPDMVGGILERDWEKSEIWFQCDRQ